MPHLLFRSTRSRGDGFIKTATAGAWQCTLAPDAAKSLATDSTVSTESEAAEPQPPNPFPPPPGEAHGAPTSSPCAHFQLVSTSARHLCTVVLAAEGPNGAVVVSVRALSASARPPVGAGIAFAASREATWLDVLALLRAHWRLPPEAWLWRLRWAPPADGRFASGSHVMWRLVAPLPAARRVADALRPEETLLLAAVRSDGVSTPPPAEPRATPPPVPPKRRPQPPETPSKDDETSAEDDETSDALSAARAQEFLCDALFTASAAALTRGETGAFSACARTGADALTALRGACALPPARQLPRGVLRLRLARHKLLAAALAGEAPRVAELRSAARVADGICAMARDAHGPNVAALHGALRTAALAVLELSLLVRRCAALRARMARAAVRLLRRLPSSAALPVAAGMCLEEAAGGDAAETREERRGKGDEWNAAEVCQGVVREVDSAAAFDAQFARTRAMLRRFAPDTAAAE